MSRIKDPKLWEIGEKKVYWADRNMPVLRKIRERYSKEKPLEGIKVGACLHITKETANLILTLKELGAEVWLAASNPLSTQDDVAAYLVKKGIEVFGKRGESTEEYYQNLREVVSQKPDIIIDDGGDLHALIHKEFDFIPIGGTEETTTGVTRLKTLERKGKLKYPVIAVNDSKTKYLFDNRYGTGQSTIDGIIRATNILLAGKTVVVAGYGWCGRGIAMRARGMGAKVIITEVDPIRALEAVMDGFLVMPMGEAAKIGDVFTTATGDKKVIRKEHIEKMKDGAILANAGHFNVEIWIPDLKELSVEKKKIRDYIEEYTLKNGREIYLLGEGRLVNLVCAEGHPLEVMDISFSNQAMAAMFLVENKEKLENRVYILPEEIDKEIARLKLESMGIRIDELTEEQRKYLSSWELGI